MAINIGSLFASLTLQSSQFTQGMRNAANQANTSTAQIKDALRGVGKEAIASFAAFKIGEFIGGQIREAFEYASSLGEVAQQLGVTTKGLQEMRFAATQVGIEQEEMDKGLAKLTVSIGKAADGNKNLQGTFSELGISVKQLGSLNTDQMLDALAQGFGNIKDPATRARLEVELFGKTGQKLDTLLAGGKQGIADLRKQMEDLGITLSDEQIQNADRTADKIAELQTVLKMKIASTVASNADAIYSLANSLLSLVGSIAKFWASDPKSTLTMLGALGGAVVGSRLGVWGAVGGAAAGALGGRYAGQNAEDASNDISLRRQRLHDARDAYNKAKHPTDPMGIKYGPNPNVIKAAENEYRRQIGLANRAAGANRAIAAIGALANAAGDGPGRNVKSAGGGGKPKHARAGRSGGSGEDPLKGYKDEMDALRDESTLLKLNNDQQDIYNAFQRAGITLTAGQTKALQDSNKQQGVFNDLIKAGAHLTVDQMQAMTDAANNNVYDKALQGWIDKTKELVKQSRDAVATIGMNEFDKKRYDINSAYEELNKNGGRTADGTIIVDGTARKKRDEALAAVADEQHAYALQMVKDLQEEAAALGMTNEQQQVYNALKRAGVDASSDMGKQIAAGIHNLVKSQELQQAAQQFADIGTNFVSSLMEGTQSWGQSFKSLVKDLGSMMLNELVYKPMHEMLAKLGTSIFQKLLGAGLGALTGGGAGMSVDFGGSMSALSASNASFMSNLTSSWGTGSITGHANGGSVTAGKSYWVGERGPELFRATHNGQIVSSFHSGDGRKGGHTFIIDAKGSSNPAETAKLVQQGILAAMPMLRQDASAYTMRKMTRPPL